MATTSTQTYAKHAHNPKLTTIAGGFAFLAFLFLAAGVVRTPTLQSVGLLCLSLAVITLVLISRAYTVRLQDRIIRLEMQGRLERLDRLRDLPKLTTKQIVALRFASDAELPALIDRALSERLTPDQIKRAVKEWQPDLYRT
jgi:hypothetical protein